MAWPLSQDYNEAIQSPASNFADADLRRGEAACNALGLPMPCSGNFADVYQVRCPDGSRWAVKCFTREAPGLRERYQEISRHLRQVKLPFTVDFTYLEQGLRVAGRWYPVLKMQWVEGLTLNQFVRQYLDKPVTLEALFQLWGRMAKYLRGAQVGHCDLQHGNVLLVPGASANMLALKLIDYDGMWVPALAGKKSGEVGHPAYQHPRRLAEGTYSMEVDRFPVLMVAAALRALKANGRPLWERYDNGDNMLFKEDDLREPAQSALVRELLQLPDAAPLTAALVKALGAGLESTPLLEELAADARPGSRPASTPPAVRAAAAPSAPGTWDFNESALPASVTPAGPARRPDLNRKGVPIRALAALVVGLVVVTAAAAVLYFASQGTPAKAPPGPAHASVDGSPNQKSTEPPPEPLPKPPEPLPKQFKNILGMEFVLVPKGKSWLGGGGGKPGEKEVEIPRDFYLGKYLVTQEEWQNVMGTNPSLFSRTGEGKAAVQGVPDGELKRFPVENVSWDDAQLFLAEVNKRAKEGGWVYRLPTEVEWEYACRGGPLADKRDSAFDYYFDKPTNQLLAGQANFEDGKGLKRPCKVGSYRPNRLGLYDMHGNLHEWCDDSIKGADGTLFLAYRGGCWGNDSGDCRAVSLGLSPRSVPGRSRHIGLRIARVPVGDDGK